MKLPSSTDSSNEVHFCCLECKFSGSMLAKEDLSDTKEKTQLANQVSILKCREMLAVYP